MTSWGHRRLKNFMHWWNFREPVEGWKPIQHRRSPILSIQEIPDRTTVDPFRHPEYTLTKFVNLCPLITNLFFRYDPFRLCYMPIPAIQQIPDRTMVDPFRHPERTWPNLSIYVSDMTRSDPVRHLHLWFLRYQIQPR